MKLFLDESLSPDPTNTTAGRYDGEWTFLTVYPHAMRLLSPGRLEPEIALENLDLRKDPGPFRCEVRAGDELDVLIDFGTELVGHLTVELKLPSGGGIACSTGESELEARDWGPASQCKGQRPRKQNFYPSSAGLFSFQIEEGAFRFARIRLAGVVGKVELLKIAVEAQFYGKERRSRFQCEDPFWQRLWESTLYTARLNTRPDEFWDGPKRDRHLWWGDGRMVKGSFDFGYFDPRPTERLLAKFPLKQWANNIPVFSFESIKMVREHLQCYGLSDTVVSSIRDRFWPQMDWIISTQCGEDGRVERRDDVEYFFKMGFVDWSPMPLGGRMEELSIEQFFWLECLQDAAWIARQLGDEPRSTDYLARAVRLRSLLRKLFRTKGGFHHTLGLAETPETPWRMPLDFGMHYQKTYVEKLNFGPSGPSLHSNARAVFASLMNPGEEAELKATLASETLPPIITGYYQAYVPSARALCGDPEGAAAGVKDYFGAMLDELQTPCIWESFEPLKKNNPEVWGINAWPKGLCHGFSCGMTRFILRHLVGAEITAPGYGEVHLHEQAVFRRAFKLTLPTPQGELTIERTEASAPVVISRHTN
ncbi:MAG: hypothetical protein HOO88_06690 [Kiritimatiellaceae bacterium]|nr:hypothetical protein [Kiritimatiellaceae bacterium]